MTRKAEFNHFKCREHIEQDAVSKFRRPYDLISGIRLYMFWSNNMKKKVVVLHVLAHVGTKVFFCLPF